jgi:hypothetical protein
MIVRSVDAAIGVQRNPKGSSQEFARPGPGGHFVDENVGREARARRTNGTSAAGEDEAASWSCALVGLLLKPKSHDMMTVSDGARSKDTGICRRQRVLWVR